MKSYFQLIACVSLVLVMTNLNCKSQDLKDSTFTFNQVIKNGEDNRLNIHEPLDMLKSQAIGVIFTKKGSDPNVFNSLNIRGKATGSQPEVLYIIDGVMGADPLMLLPDDIESIEIIRDGAQLTAYGTQGCSGVVIIKTRQYSGDKKISVNFSSFVTLNAPSKKYDLLTADHVRATVQKYDLNFTDGGSNTDWQDEVMRKTVSQIYNLGISGRLNTTIYDFSAFYDKNPGIVRSTSDKNNGANLKLRHSALDNKISLFTNIAYNSVNHEILLDGSENAINEILIQTLKRNPTDPIFEADGITYHQSERVFRYINPLQIIDAVENNATTKNFRLSAGGNYKIMKGLDAGINFGYSNLDYTFNYFQPVEAFNNMAEELKKNSSILTRRLNTEVNINYNKAFDQYHNLSFGILVGYRDLTDESEYYTNYRSYSDTSIYNVDRNYTNFIANAGYNYRQRYYLSAIANIESSELIVSGFPTAINQLNRKKFYPSLMAGWKISNEDFLNKSGLISNLMLKATYGIRGNGNADENIFYRYYAGIDSLNTEKITELSLALDFGFIRNRLTGSVNWYNRNIKNAVGILYLPVPPYTNSYTYRNTDVYQSNGIEVVLLVKAIERENFKWNSQLNFYKNNDELIKGNYRDSEGSKTGFFNYFGDMLSTQLYRTGSPSRVFYLPQHAGYSEDGRALYYTKTGTKTREIVMAKFDVMSQTEPKFYLGWVNSFNIFKDFDASVSMSYAGGFSIYNATRMHLSQPYFLPSLNISEEGLENLEAGYQQSPILSELYLEDASYLRIDDITFSYTFRCKKMNNRGQLQVFASAGNILTITDYTGYDPAGDSDGVDYFDVYPLAKTYTAGVKINF